MGQRSAEGLSQLFKVARPMKFSYLRTTLWAFGWYLTFLAIAVVIGLVVGTGSVGFLESIDAFQPRYQRSYLEQRVVITLCHVVLGTMLLRSRPKSIANVLLVLLGVALSVPSGVLGGLIPLAVLTTRPTKVSPEVIKVFE